MSTCNTKYKLFESSVDSWELLFNLHNFCPEETRAEHKNSFVEQNPYYGWNALIYWTYGRIALIDWTALRFRTNRNEEAKSSKAVLL